MIESSWGWTCKGCGESFTSEILMQPCPKCKQFAGARVTRYAEVEVVSDLQATLAKTQRGSELAHELLRDALRREAALEAKLALAEKERDEFAKNLEPGFAHRYFCKQLANPPGQVPSGKTKAAPQDNPCEIGGNDDSRPPIDHLSSPAVAAPMLPPEPYAVTTFRRDIANHNSFANDPEILAYIDLLRTAAELLAKDAARYQWLRAKAKRNPPVSNNKHAGDIHVIQWADRTEANTLRMEELDAAVDSAIAQQEGK